MKQLFLFLFAAAFTLNANAGGASTWNYCKVNVHAIGDGTVYAYPGNNCTKASTRNERVNENETNSMKYNENTYYQKTSDGFKAVLQKMDHKKVDNGYDFSWYIHMKVTAPEGKTLIGFKVAKESTVATDVTANATIIFSDQNSSEGNYVAPYDSRIFDEGYWTAEIPLQKVVEGLKTYDKGQSDDRKDEGGNYIDTEQSCAYDIWSDDVNYETNEIYIYPIYADKYERTATEGNLGTICVQCDAEVENAILYTLSNTTEVDTDGKLTHARFVSVDYAEAGKGYLFQATEDKVTATYDTNTFYGADAVIGKNVITSLCIMNNGIIGNLGDEAMNVTTNKYIVSGNKLVRSAADTGVTIGKNRAYIDPTQFVAAEAPSEGKYEFTVDFDEPTAISDVMEKITAEGQWFNARGEKVAQPTSGVFIKNGVKYIFK